MLIIVNDDPAYRSWIARHRDGFVVDCQRKPTKGHVVLHRATCPLIKPHGRARLTSGAHIKVCSLHLVELSDWTREETAGGLQNCPECSPEQSSIETANQPATHALTRLGRDVVSYVLDLAVIYLDGEAPHFRPTIGQIAQYLEKTPPQIRPTIERLVADGHLTCDSAEAPAKWSDETLVRPTAKSLSSIPAFGAMGPADLLAELDRLQGGTAA